tara:strand:- start:9554 stop:9985 length:432 start_codon:yes stop_codon:yes gene_type:complete
MGTYRDNTPNYNVNKVVKFSDFEKEIQKKETEDFKRGFVKNSQNNKMTKNSKLKFNDKTGKMDDVTLSEVDDKLKSLKESASDESLEIIQKLTQYLEDHPGIRFGQALFNLDINEFNKDGSLIYRDIYNDSDEEILKRVNKNF